jgi:hypothetical protein
MLVGGDPGERLESPGEGGMMNKRRKVLLVVVGLMVVFALAVPVQAGPPLMYWHAKAGLINLAQPVGTQWHELYPTFCSNYTLTSWEDNGDGILSSCDTIDVQRPDGEVEWYHVENVTITLYVRFEEDGENGPDSPLAPLEALQPIYIEHEGGYDPAVLKAPNCTYWHEIYPNFCTRYHLINWKDSNPTDKLDPCDSILLQKEDFDSVRLGDGVGDVIDNHMATPWHVEEVAIDIVVSPAPPVGGEAYPVSRIPVLAPWIAVGVILAGGISWYVLRRRRAQS